MRHVAVVNFNRDWVPGMEIGNGYFEEVVMNG